MRRQVFALVQFLVRSVVRVVLNRQDGQAVFTTTRLTHSANDYEVPSTPRAIIPGSRGDDCNDHCLPDIRMVASFFCDACGYDRLFGLVSSHRVRWFVLVLRVSEACVAGARGANGGCGELCRWVYLLFHRSSVDARWFYAFRQLHSRNGLVLTPDSFLDANRVALLDMGRCGFFGSKWSFEAIIESPASLADERGFLFQLSSTINTRHPRMTRTRTGVLKLALGDDGSVGDPTAWAEGRGMSNIRHLLNKQGSSGQWRRNEQSGCAP